MAFVCLSSVPAVIRHCALFPKKDMFHYDGLSAKSPLEIETVLRHLMFLNLITSGRGRAGGMRRSVAKRSALESSAGGYSDALPNKENIYLHRTAQPKRFLRKVPT